MKNKSFIFVTLLLPTLFSCSGPSPIAEGNFYLSGIGSFNESFNYEINEKNKFLKEINDNYQLYYTLKAQPLSLGDSFSIIDNSNKYNISYENIKVNEGSISSKNISLFSEENNVSFMVTESGTYDISVGFKDQKHIEVSIYNSGSTESFNPNDKPTVPTSISLMANGDHHGMVLETKENKLVYPAIEQYVSYLKYAVETTEEEDIILSNGDLWQGTLQSNLNQGALLSEVITHAGYSSLTLGNHEFDWGQNVIKENSLKYDIPFLGANIINKDTNQIVEYARPFNIVEKSNLRVGIIGAIGPSQIEDILSTNVSDISFVSPKEVIKKYSDILRKYYYCDIVVLSIHESTSNVKDMIRTGLGQISNVTNKKYIDAAFAAHDHNATTTKSGDVPIVNSGNFGRFIGNIRLTYNNGEVSLLSSELLCNSNDKVPSIHLFEGKDETTNQIVNKYYTDDLKTKANSVCATFESSFGKSTLAPNLEAKAMYDLVKNEHNVVASFVNQARKDISSGPITYSDLFTSFPFTNRPVVLSIKGKDLRSANGLSHYGEEPFSIEDDKEYLIVTLDYCAYHQSTNRVYDYFPNATIIKTFDISPYDFIFDYLINIDKPIDSTDYSGEHFNFLY